MVPHTSSLSALRSLPAGARELLQPLAAQADPVLADTLAILAGLDADAEVLAAALLFAAGGAADEAARKAAIAALPGVAALLEGQSAAEQVWALHAASQSRSANNEGLRRLLLAIIHDLRVVPILLARQLAQLRVAAQRPQSERRALAQLTRDIHAPLANRLGIWQLKWELEDLAFRFLEPDTYRHIARLLDEKRGERERYIERVKQALRDALAENGIHAEVSGRPKHIYSIWRKMQRKGGSIDALYDLRAVRVAVEDIPTCYAALGIVHALWAPIPSEFDDYIARPKANDYRSLHTAVVGPEGRTLEVQIRTFEMHAQAELGVAAHWRYKESGSGSGGKGGDKSFERKIAWMRRLLEQSVEGGAGEADDIGDSLGAELVEERIYVLTPKGEVVDLPRGGTVLDFAYHVHTMVGHRTRGAKVDGRIVPLNHVLRSGDRVEIMTAKEPEPRRDWLLQGNGFLASGRSRDKVRAWFHKLDKANNVQAGREVLERELKRLGLHQHDLGAVLKRFRADSLDDLYIQVALGDVGPNQIGRALHEDALDKSRQAKAAPASQHPGVVNASRKPAARPSGADTSRFTVQGVGNLLVALAKCCQPVAGEPIAGYLTRGRGVTVHRAGCAALLRLAAANPQRVLPVEWGVSGGGYEADVMLSGVDRKYLLKDITNLIAQEDAHVLDIHSEALRDSGRIRFRLRLKVSDYGQLSTVLGKLDALPGVESVKRSG